METIKKSKISTASLKDIWKEEYSESFTGLKDIWQKL
jgi:hypothetical protein